ncbi:zinc finger protein 277 [Anopheles ziemanni]|uniref:zinc finger protein 277 n=1 Tax=Anopheles coustani TaxID=139045 RepID=UPI00265A9D55|nr:zinc finger protein 277 [Anopheles coustani]XP_058172283.1 zinc finger protein 277 [Anopheles ziemanni]
MEANTLNNISSKGSHEESSRSSIVGPLNFAKDTSNLEPPTSLVNERTVPCMFCSNIYDFHSRDNGVDQYLAHLYLVHRLIVGDVKEIACLPSYCYYWKDKFSSEPADKYCSSMLLNQLPDGTSSSNEKYFLLSDIEPLDYELRQRLKREKLDLVLTRHQFERTDRNYRRDCLYCRDFRSETRPEFISHLYAKHFLLLGKSEHLVFVDELIEIVQDKLNQLICLYCEKVFKDRPTLKEHMRKKGHKRINPDNHYYDRFFLVNYRLKQKPEYVPIAKRKEESSVFNSDEDSDSDWSDWNGEEQTTTCLFCTHSEANIDKLKQHMVDKHSFDFTQTVHGMSFYQRVKVVNFIRRQMHIRKCIACEQQFNDYKSLCEHMDAEEHYRLSKESSGWDQPEYFFPTYEDDQFLCHLEEIDNEEPTTSEEDGSIVISEDFNARINIDAESLSLENFSLQ